MNNTNRIGYNFANKHFCSRTQASWFEVRKRKIRRKEIRADNRKYKHIRVPCKGADIVNRWCLAYLKCERAIIKRTWYQFIFRNFSSLFNYWYCFYLFRTWIPSLPWFENNSICQMHCSSKHFVSVCVWMLYGWRWNETIVAHHFMNQHHQINESTYIR